MAQTPPPQKPTSDEVLGDLMKVIGHARGKDRMSDFADSKQAIDFLRKLNRPVATRIFFAAAQITLIGMSIGATLLYQFGTSPHTTRTHDWIGAVALTLICALIYFVWLWEEEL